MDLIIIFLAKNGKLFLDHTDPLLTISMGRDSIRHQGHESTILLQSKRALFTLIIDFLSIGTCKRV